MAQQAQSFFLEQWLRSISMSTSPSNAPTKPSSSSAQAIIKAWADIRDLLQHQTFHAHHLQALRTLVDSQSSLYVSDPQAKLLLSILSSQGIVFPVESYPLFLRLLYIWVRKSRQTSLVDSAVEIASQLFSRLFQSDKSPYIFSEGLLLLGSLSLHTSAAEKSKALCLEILCKSLEEQWKSMFLSDELASHALAGIGYALSSSSTIYFGRLLNILLSIWGDEGGPLANSSQGLMVLHLIELVMSNSLNARSLHKVDLIKKHLEKPAYSSFSVVMVSAGIIRAVNRSGSNGFLHLKTLAEDCIETVARDLVSMWKDSNIGGIRNHAKLDLGLRSIALAFARTGSVSYRASLLISLALAIVTQVFALGSIYNKILELPQENWIAVLVEIRNLLNDVVFKEAGSITGVFCNMYGSAEEDSQITVENIIWKYCQEIYVRHRQARRILLGREGDEIIKEIEKIAESAFLMVVVFALEVTKHRLDLKINQEAKAGISVGILASFSCMEYFRRMRLPEYMDTVRAVIGSLQENESACVSFVESMPCYDDLIHTHGPPGSPNIKYLWSSDDVQTARIVFYMRVIPTCVEGLPASSFKKIVAPIMFLYLGHPNGKVARYSHSIFSAFVSSGKEALQEDERVVLKEQLVFYYIQRSLEIYPGITPFEGMASGVAALVRHLPAGSPCIFYAIHSLIEKANSLCSLVGSKETDLWTNWEGEQLESCKKVLDLLLRLLALVDIQVLPSLMKLLAQFIIELPPSGQNLVMNQLYQQIAESDDVIRKPALVSWLQSLSYLSSTRNLDSVSLNRVNARL